MTRRRLVFVSCLLLTLAAAVVWRFRPAEPPPARRADPAASHLWNPAPGAPSRAEENRERAEALGALPYLQGYEPAPSHSGVTRHDRAASLPGLNLYNSGHAAEALLIDMEGSVRHRWSLEAQAVWPDIDRTAEGAKYWRRVHPFENGDLLVVHDGFGVVKLDRASRRLWAFAADCHHDLFVGHDGRIHVLSRSVRSIPEVHPSLASLDESIVVLDSEGRLLRQVSLYDAFRRSRYSSVLERAPRGGELFHTNTLTLLDGSLAGRWPLLKKGRALVSFRSIDTVALVDLEAEEVVWALTGLWHRQHEPAFLPSGHLLVFDNAGRRGRTRVLEVDPWTQEVAWAYPTRAEDIDLFSATSGTAYRLANGNTLITESTAGRALEVTAAGRVAWEFWSPHRAGAQQELIATLFDLVRLPADFAGFGPRPTPRSAVSR